MLLSEKAKGKQRAVDPPEQPEAPPLATRTITIRFTEDVPDLDISVNEADAVRDLKKYIRRERPRLKDRRLRLIHSGRLLTDGTFVYSWLKSLDERQQRAASSENGESQPPQSAIPTWLHCSVGREIDTVEEETDEGKVQTSQIQPVRGFDRLASLGFTESEIALVRRQFHSQSPGLLDDRDFDNDEDYDEHARALEEQWIDNLDSTDASLSQSSSSGSPAIMGILTGFFFPFIPFFVNNNRPPPPVFWEDGTEHRAPENVVFSKTMQMGLVAGFLANILFGMWRFLLDTT